MTGARICGQALHDIQASHVNLQCSTDQIVTLSSTAIGEGEDVATPAYVDGLCLFEDTEQLLV